MGMKVNFSASGIVRIIPKLAGIPLHQQCFLRVAAGDAAATFQRGKTLCRKHSTTLTSALIN